MSDLRGDLTQVVVAEDLFTLCEPEMELGESERVQEAKLCCAGCLLPDLCLHAASAYLPTHTNKGELEGGAVLCCAVMWCAHP